MSAQTQPHYLTPSEYLLGENDRPDGEKYEYVEGQAYAMVGASRGHNKLSLEFARQLSNHLRGSRCSVFHSDMKVGIETAGAWRFYYPDVQVSCEAESAQYYNTAPCLIIEILSPSTERVDRMEKLVAYRQLASLQEYVLCSQDSPHVEIYRRRTTWQVEYYTGNDTFRLDSVGLDVSVAALYAE